MILDDGCGYEGPGPGVLCGRGFRFLECRACATPGCVDSRLRGNDGLRGRSDEGMSRMTKERLLERSIPDRSLGHAFVPIAHPGWRRHTKV